MNQCSKDIVALLVVASAGWTTPEWPLINAAGSSQNCLYNLERDDKNAPDEFTTIFDLPQTEPQSPKHNNDECILQVRVRASDQDRAWAQIQKIKLELEGKAPFTESGTPYNGIWSQSNIGFIGTDNERRFIYTWTLRVLREATPAGNRT